MNHPIGCRGKRLDNGEWIFGIVFPHDEGSCTMVYLDSSDSSFKGVEVDRNTIGQDTGMTDRDGKMIFEGDILLYHTDDPVGLQKPASSNRVDSRTRQFLGVEKRGLTAINFKDWDIVGNIYDNPELMERVRK